VYLTLVNWAVGATGLQAVPTSTINFVGSINECVPFPDDPGSVLDKKFYKLTACTTPPAPAVSSVTGSLCTDSACTACESTVFEYNAIAAALGVATPSPFDPTSASLVTRIVCNGVTAPTRGVMLDLVGYPGIGPGVCGVNGTKPTQYVPTDGAFGGCSPFLTGVDGSYTNGRFYRFDNCTSTTLNFQICADPGCNVTDCVPFSLPTDVANPCVPDPVIPGQSLSIAGFQCPTTAPPPMPPASKFYQCVKGQCVGSNSTGGSGGPPKWSLPVCQYVCLDDSDRYLCENGACVLSVEPGRGISKADCLQVCLK
jgi:hypothetical protein